MPKISDIAATNTITSLDTATAYLLGNQGGVTSCFPVALLMPSMTHWFTGSGPPGGLSGNAGDYYFDYAENTVYWMTNGSWTVLSNVNGNIWYSGTLPPVFDTGSVDDFYLDYHLGDIYQKTVSGWGSPLMRIKGVSPKEFVYSYGGPLSVNTGKLRKYISTAHTIVKVVVRLATAATGSSIKFDLLKNGVAHTVFASDQEIPINTTGVDFTSFLDAELFVDDTLTINITQVGSTIPGSDLTITIIME